MREKMNAKPTKTLLRDSRGATAHEYAALRLKVAKLQTQNAALLATLEEVLQYIHDAPADALFDAGIGAPLVGKIRAAIAAAKGEKS